MTDKDEADQQAQTATYTCGVCGVSMQMEQPAQQEPVTTLFGTLPVYDTSPPQQEPVAWRTFDGEGGYEYRSYDMNEQYAQEWEQRNPKHKGWVEPLYTSPPAQRTWVNTTTWRGMTDEELQECWYKTQGDVGRAIEAKLKEKNT